MWNKTIKEGLAIKINQHNLRASHGNFFISFYYNFLNTSSQLWLKYGTNVIANKVLHDIFRMCILGTRKKLCYVCVFNVLISHLTLIIFSLATLTLTQPSDIFYTQFTHNLIRIQYIDNILTNTDNLGATGHCRWFHIFNSWAHRTIL